MKKQLLYITLISLFLVACSGGEPGETPTPQPQVKIPTAASLVSPANNTECNQGNIISTDLSSVLFQWNPSENTNTYTLKVTNLNTNTVQEQSSSNTSLSMALKRGTPFSWKVVSKSNSTTQTAESGTFRFFNAGAPVENHTPFPAEAVSPSRGATLTGVTSITIEWESSDIDNDLAAHTVQLLGSSEVLDQVDFDNETTVTYQTTTTQSINEVAVEAGKIYYWQVKSQDEVGNSATSEIFEFRVN
ncbi:MAG: hypothetical protein VW961_06785 [Flavobacteriaceae bacterium]|jgi:hypothetical protein